MDIHMPWGGWDAPMEVSLDASLLAWRMCRPRDGRDWSAIDITRVMVEDFGLDPVLAVVSAFGGSTLCGNPFAFTFSLGQYGFPDKIQHGLGLSTHNCVEHDASLTRTDAYLGDWIRVNVTLVESLKNISNTLNGQGAPIDIVALGDWKQRQYATSKRYNPTFLYGPIRVLLGSSEMALVLTLLAGKEGINGTIRQDFFDSWFVQERIPDAWQMEYTSVERFAVMAAKAYASAPVPPSPPPAGTGTAGASIPPNLNMTAEGMKCGLWNMLARIDMPAETLAGYLGMPVASTYQAVLAEFVRARYGVEPPICPPVFQS
jgi:hypothetical protein